MDVYNDSIKVGLWYATLLYYVLLLSGVLLILNELATGNASTSRVALGIALMIFAYVFYELTRRYKFAASATGVALGAKIVSMFS